MIKIKVTDYELSQNGFIILYDGVIIQILDNDLTPLYQFYGHRKSNPVIVNAPFDNVTNIPNHYYLTMNSDRFLKVEQQCLKDKLNYNYIYKNGYLYKKPNSIKVMIKDKLYNSSIIVVYDVLKNCLIVDCCRLIINQILQLHIDDDTSYGKMI